MYTPRAYAPRDTEQLLSHMRSHGFAIFVTPSAHGAPAATHVPVVVRASGTNSSSAIQLAGHIAKANPQCEWLRCNADAEALVIFPGPHAYISPKALDKKASVPTWNYTAVHAYGIVRPVLDVGALLIMLEELSMQYEPSYQEQWRQLPEPYRLGMLSGIAGFEMDVARIEGSFKLSQEKSEQERSRIAENLRRSGIAESVAIADLMDPATQDSWMDARTGSSATTSEKQALRHPPITAAPRQPRL